MTSKTTHNELRDLRLKAGLSLESAAEGICSVSYLSLLERGQREASLVIKRGLEARYGLSAGSIEGGVVESVAFEAFMLSVRLGKIQEARQLIEDLHRPTEVSLANGLISEALGDHKLAIDQIQLATELGALSTGQLASGLLALTRAYRELGDFYSAVNAGERLLTHLKSGVHQVEVTELEAKATLSSIYLEVGDYFRAEQLVSQESVEAKTTKDSVLSLWAKAMVHYAAGNLVFAANLLEAASEMSSIISQPLTEARMFQSAMWLRVESGGSVSDDEILRLTEALGLFEKEELKFDVAQTANTLSMVRLRERREGDARELVERSLIAATGLEAFQKSEVLALNAKVFLELGELTKAHQLLDEAAKLLEQCPANRASANVWSQLGAAYERANDAALALACFKKASVVGGLLPTQQGEGLAAAPRG